MKGMKLTALIGLIYGTLPLCVSAQVVVLRAPGAEETTTTDASGQTDLNFAATPMAIQPVLPPQSDYRHYFEQHPTTQERRGIGIGTQSSGPTIAPQFNEPMIGQQGPPPVVVGSFAESHLLPPGVSPGLSDRGLIFPEPGTIIVGPQGNANELNGAGNVGGFGFRGAGRVFAPNNTTLRPNNTTIGQQGFGTAIGPNNISPASSASRNGNNTTTLTPTGRSSVQTRASGARGGSGGR